MVIPAFPNFYPLNLEDKKDYEELISELPPLSDITFATLHIWWNLEGKLGLSSLDGNLILNYSLPFDTKNSGWCLIGKHNLDQSIQEIFAYLKDHQRPRKLVHVPEFVVNEIKHTDSLLIEEEADYHEYICDSRQLASLEGHDHSRTRRKVSRFLREVDGKNMVLKELDLSDREVKELIYHSIEQWQVERLAEVDPDGIAIRAIKQTLDQSHRLETRNLALFVDEQLQGITLYHLSHDKNHYIVTHLKVNYETPYIFDYLTNQVAVKALKDGIPYLNMEMDLGIEGLRQHKQGLRPINFFKKYTLSPK
jgi:hypothetical protein